MIKHHVPAKSYQFGPYTPGVEVVNARKLLFVSGQGPVDLETGEKYLGEDIGKQAKLTLENLKNVIEKSGFTLQDVVKVTIFLIDMTHISIVNKVYSEYFPSKQPARSTVAVAELPSGQAIEIEAIAVKE